MSDETRFVNGRVVVKTGDITKEDADAVVNAANSTLLGGGGVDGAIHRAGGPAILEACREIRRTQWEDGLPTGQAVITTAGNMPAVHVIHTVGPVWGQGGPELLANCYRNCLRLAVENGLKSIAFPAISTGVYRFPKDLAAEVSSRIIDDFLKEDDSLEDVRLVFFAPGSRDTFLANCVWR